MSNKIQGRIYAFDILRIISACAVVMIHTSAEFLNTSNGSLGGFFLANLLNSLSRFAVPVFVMISGALMLDENKSISSGKMLKTTLNMLGLLFMWSFFYAVSYDLIRPIFFHQEISVKTIIYTLFHGHYHMWYIHMLIGLYAITPILRFFIKKENATLVLYYLTLSVLICFVVPFLNHILNHFWSEEDVLASFIDKFRLQYFNGYLIYYVLGWYITHVGIQKKPRRFVYLMGIAGLALTVIGTQIHFDIEQENYFLLNSSINIFFYGVAVFTWGYHFMQTKNISLGKNWLKLSNYTFGVYLIHCLFLFLFKKLTDGISLVSIRILLMFIPSVILSFLTVSIVDKIPFLKKFVRG